MYWAVRDDGKFEIIDGQQRTISICRYVNGSFSVKDIYFYNLTKSEQSQILNYKLMIYQCSGTDKERLEWFETINIAGKPLTKQELRNAIYSGSWLTDAKRYFSKSSRPKTGDKYLKGKWNRQEFLETAINWISDGNIEKYMAKNQHKTDAKELWLHFENVINWVKATFTNYRKEMKGIDWGTLYRDYKDESYDSKELEKQIAKLMEDEDVENKKGIYQYVLTREERHLNIRAFSEKQKREAYERQKGICKICKEKFEMEEMEADHIDPWHSGGKTIAENCQMLCKKDNRRKGGK